MRVLDILDTDVKFYTIPTCYLKIGDKVFVQTRDPNNKIIIKEVTVDTILAVRSIPDSEIDL